MPKDLNKVQLIGRLGADPETRYTPQGSAITKLRVATGRKVKEADSDEYRDETEWTNIVAWNKLAEICAQFLRKGARVYIEGRLQTRSWDDEESGQKRYMTEVIANDMIMLDSRNDGAGRGDDGDDDYGNPEPEPVRQSQPARQPARSQAPSRQPAAAAHRGTRPGTSGAPPSRRPVAATNDDDDLPF